MHYVLTLYFNGCVIVKKGWILIEWKELETTVEWILSSYWERAHRQFVHTPTHTASHTHTVAHTTK
jgi:hypothetical protein